MSEDNSAFQETSEVINERFQVNPVTEMIPDAENLPSTSEVIFTQLNNF